MNFHPNNRIVQLCLQGTVMAETGQTEEAHRRFLQAWNEAADDHEKFLTSYHLAQQQKDVSAKLEWFETARSLAVKINDSTVHSAFPRLYAALAQCHEELHRPEEAKKYRELAAAGEAKPSDQGPFYHGTKADLRPGDLLKAGGDSNYQAGLTMNHIYFTALASGAGLAATLAKGDGRERVYVVEPTGDFEDDPNVTNKKFPGNPTRSYRSRSPLRIVGEAADWLRQTPEDLRKWREKLAQNQGKIIN